MQTTITLEDGTECESTTGMLLLALDYYEIAIAAEDLGPAFIRSELARRVIDWPAHCTSVLALEEEARVIWAWATAPAEEMQ